MHKHVFNFLNANSVITSLQSGFVPGDSIVNQLIDIYNTFSKALDDGLEVKAIFCDISKAFDRVWHKGLLLKLQSVGLTGPLLEWFQNYLCDRKQRVVLPGRASDWVNITAEVPQLSILGPLLFLIYINDIVKDIQSTIRLFADDTNLYILLLISWITHQTPSTKTWRKHPHGQTDSWFYLILKRLNLFSFCVKLINLYTHP